MSDDAPEAPLPLIAETDSGLPIARPALGLTAYLAEPDSWARGGASKALKVFLERAPRKRLEFLTTSVMTEWRALAQRELEALADELTAQVLLLKAPRHHFTLSLVDVPDLPEVGFSYTEIDPKRGDRAGVLELTLPPETPPSQLVDLAKAIAEIGPLFSMVGGCVVRWSPIFQNLAFDQIYLWSRRYVGFDVQDAEEMAWHAPESLPGTGWLTLVGNPLAETIDCSPEKLLRQKWKEKIEVHRTSAGVLIQAGSEPSWGDLNAFAFPDAYAEVARALKDGLPKAPPRLQGAFRADDLTLQWLRRFVEPGKWIVPAPD
ncbi:MAG: type VI immunity family protein [Myxococcaceae bacterium]